MLATGVDFVQTAEDVVATLVLATGVDFVQTAEDVVATLVLATGVDFAAAIPVAGIVTDTGPFVRNAIASTG